MFNFFVGLVALRVVAASTVNINGGSLRCNDLHGVTECLGIPFAKPPTGELRWKPPVDIEHVSPSPYDAHAFGPSCPQSSGQLINASYISESCLTLNFWIPKHTTPRATMVFFYGGGFSQGGTSTYNASTLAVENNVVVVSTNYRLGALGFASWREQTARKQTTGNFGFMDQQAALRWVSRHGPTAGMPARVTLFGQSAGADSVLAHVLAESSRGLFESAILESGGYDVVQDLEFMSRVADGVASRVGCHSTDRLACMRKKTVAEILAAGGGHAGPSGSGNPILDCGTVAHCENDFGPTADGVLFNQTGWQLLAKGKIPGVTPGSNLSVMAGTCTSDGSLFAVGYYDTINASLYERFLTVLLTKDARLKGHPLTDPKDIPKASVARAMALYPPSRATDPAVELAENEERLSVAITDAKFACPTRFIVGQLLSAPEINARAWVYRFDHNVTFASPCAGQWNKRYGNASHTAELPFVFGRPLTVFGPQAGPPCVFSAPEKSLARDMGRFWTALAAAGDPGKAWTPWTPAHQLTNQMDADLVLDTASPGPGVRVEHGWGAGPRCDFWMDTKWLPPARHS